MKFASAAKSLIVASALVVSVVGASAQSPKKLEFEVASVKPNKSGERGMQMRISPGHVIAKNVAVQNFITIAFDVKDFQVSGGPSWLTSDRFDLDAKTGDEDETPPASLTQEDFKKRNKALQERMQSLLAGGGPEARQQMRMGRGELSAKKVSMDALANQLSGIAGRIIVNKTGLTGDYDFELEWTPDTGNEKGGLPPGSDAPPAGRLLRANHIHRASG